MCVSTTTNCLPGHTWHLSGESQDSFMGAMWISSSQIGDIQVAQRKGIHATGISEGLTLLLQILIS